MFVIRRDEINMALSKSAKKRKHQVKNSGKDVTKQRNGQQLEIKLLTKKTPTLSERVQRKENKHRNRRWEREVS